MKKILKKIGNSLGITFTQEEKRVYSLKEGVIIDLANITIEYPTKKEKKNDEK